MKKFLQNMVKRAQRFQIRDYTIFKFALFICGIWFATIIPAVTTINARISGSIWIVLSAYLVWVMFRKEKNSK